MTEVAGALRVTYGARSWCFDPGQRVLIGRGAECHIFVDRPGVSRVHAEAAFDGQWIVRDLGSTNGSYVDGTRVSVHRLSGPQELRLGDPVDGATVCLDAVDLGTISTPPPVSRSDVMRAWPLPPQGAVLGIGRGQDNAVVADDLLVSRHHVELRGTSTGVTADDLHSHNGTFVNGEPVGTARPLVTGDLLTVGQRGFCVDDGWLVEVDYAAEPAGLVAEGLCSVLSSGTALLDDVSFVLEKNQLLAVVGPSGAGKSTLLGALTGSRPATSGTVAVEGRNLYDDYADLRRRIGLVPQDDVVHRQLTVRQALGYAAELRFADDVSEDELLARIDAVLAELGLVPHADTRIDKLSGGQRKRTSVALELLTKPSLLFLDEPTSGLDPGLDKQVMQTLRGLADDGRGVVVITHNVANLGLCDRVLVLAPGGGTAFYGPPSELLEYFGVADPADIFTGIADDPAGSRSRFRSSHLRRRQLSSRRARPLAPAGTPAQETHHARGEFPRQVGVLCRRHLRVIVADRSYAAFLLFMPIVLGVLALAVPGDHGFTVPAPAAASSEAWQLLVILVLGAVFMGSASSIRELVNERGIFRREVAAGLGTRAYVTAKVIVLTGVALLQCGVLVGLVLSQKPAPPDAVVLGSGGLELYVAMVAAAFASVTLGLLFSSFISTAEQGMPLLVVSIMAQLVLCGGLFPITGRAVLEQVSWLTPARWSYAGAAGTTDLNTFPGATDDFLWSHDPWIWLACLAILLTYGAACGFIAHARAARTARSGTR